MDMSITASTGSKTSEDERVPKAAGFGLMQIPRLMHFKKKQAIQNESHRVPRYHTQRMFACRFVAQSSGLHM